MSADFGATMLGVTSGISSFTTFLPSLSEVRKASADDPQMVGDVRMGEVASITLTMGIGAISSALTRSALPTYVAFLVCLVLVILYETALRGNSPFSPRSINAATE